MSQITQKKPHHFGPLNSRKGENRVGQTYGERREKTVQPLKDPTQGLFQKIRDRFLGTRKASHIEPFAHKDDRYLDPKTPSDKSIMNRTKRLESGQHLQSRVIHPPKDRYVGFLETVIQFLDAKKNPRKV